MKIFTIIFLAIALFLLIVALASLFWGATLYALFNWVFLGLIAEPVFGLEGLTPLSFIQCWGIGLILGLLTGLFTRPTVTLD